MEYIQITEQIASKKPSERPEDWANVKKFFRFRNQLSFKKGVIVYKGRIFVTPRLQPKVLKWVHSAHQGYTNMMARVNKIVWWPDISKDVSNLREKCGKCTKDAPTQVRDPPEELIVPRYPFQHLCIDYFEVKNMLTCILVF